MSSNFLFVVSNCLTSQGPRFFISIFICHTVVRVLFEFSPSQKDPHHPAPDTRYTSKSYPFDIVIKRENEEKKKISTYLRDEELKITKRSRKLETGLA